MGYRKWLSVFCLVSMCILNLQSQNLSDHQWENRLLLLLTKDTNSQEYKKQVAELREEAAGLKDRKLIIYTLTPQQYHTGLDLEKKWKKSAGLFQKYHQNEAPFEVILIGLDGGIKLRQSDVLSCQQLFALIDRMPMRRQELRRRNQ